MFQYRGNITKDFILSKLTQEEIFNKYLLIYPDFFETYYNPLRTDNNPGCKFYSKNGIIYFTDRSWGKHWDCFNVVEYVYNINFKQSLRKIAVDFNLIAFEEDNYNPIPLVQTEKTKKKIEISKRDWYKEDVDFWSKGGVPFTKHGNIYKSEVLDFFRVNPICTAWLDGHIIYTYKRSDPCYSYYFRNGNYKLYFPLVDRSSKRARFITNTTVIQGLEQLPEFGDLLLITKSYKDVISAFMLDTPSISLQAESMILQKDDFIELYNRFDKIVSLYDFDYTGICTANKLRKLYDIEPFFFTNGRFYTQKTGAKDLTEYIDIHKLTETKKLINKIKNARDI